MTIARRYQQAIGKKILDIEAIKTEKIIDTGNKRIWWVFEDGSAIGLDINEVVYVSDNYACNRVSNFNRPIRRI